MECVRVCVCVQALNFRFILPLENFVLLNSNNNDNQIRVRKNMFVCVCVVKIRAGVDGAMVCLYFSCSFFYSPSHVFRLLSAKIIITHRFIVNNGALIPLFIFIVRKNPLRARWKDYSFSENDCVASIRETVLPLLIKRFFHILTQSAPQCSIKTFEFFLSSIFVPRAVSYDGHQYDMNIHFHFAAKCNW